jgi:RecA-family ATPase
LNDEIKLISAEELQKKEILPLKWIVKDLLPEGLTILAGSPKHGKSLLAMNVAIAAAMGKPLMNKFETSQGKILFLPFEDGERRFQKRINDISKGYSLDNAPKDLLIPQNCYFPELNASALALIEKFIDQYDIQLVVIDTFGASIPAKKISQNYNYLSDYQMMKNYQQLATKKRISIIMIHHTRKAKAESVFDEISGTTGITGASDVNMVLQKNVLESTLHIQGRDIEDKIYRLNFSKDNFIYTFSGEGDTTKISPERKMILDIFEENKDREMKAEEVVSISGKKDESIRQLLRSMKMNGQLVDGSKYGYYKLPIPN